MTDSIIPEEGGVDYEAVEIPEEEPSEYDYRERRADLYMRLQSAGAVGRLPTQTELADEYGVSQPQISRDLNRLAEYGSAQLFDRDRELWETDLAVRRCIEGLLEEGEWRAAAKTALEREEWRAGAVDLVELRERVEEIESRSDTGEVTL